MTVGTRRQRLGNQRKRDTTLTNFRVTLGCVFSILATLGTGDAGAAELSFPPKLPGGGTVVIDNSPKFLKPVSKLRAGVEIARTPPVVEFLYYPQQTYPGNPWSVWGDSLAALHFGAPRSGGALSLGKLAALASGHRRIGLRGPQRWRYSFRGSLAHSLRFR